MLAFCCVYTILLLLIQTTSCLAKAKPQFNQHDMHLSQFQSDKLVRLLCSKNVAIQFDFYQREHSECDLLRVQQAATEGTNFFRISSSSYNNSIKLEFSLGPSLTKVLIIHAPLSDQQQVYHKLVLVLNGNALTVVQNCRQLLHVNDFDLARFGTAVFNQHVYFGGSDPHFCGHVREFTVDAGTDILSSKCPDLDVVVNNTVSAFLLQRTSAVSTRTDHFPAVRHIASTYPSNGNNNDLGAKIENIQSQFIRWSNILNAFDARIKKLELIQRGCRQKGIVMAFGERREYLENCTECQCSSLGELHCGPIGCPKLECLHPVHNVGACCPICGTQCLYNGQYYENGEEFWPKQCVRCHCHNGLVDCQFKQQPFCPPLSCPIDSQETPAGQCCPVCKHQNYCDPGKNSCHEHATCENGPFSAVCKCKQGFFGNGSRCYDINECLWSEDASELLGGCLSGTICINLPGSFKCDCLPGFQKLDDRRCLDIIRI